MDIELSSIGKVRSALSTFAVQKEYKDTHFTIFQLRKIRQHGRKRTFQSRRKLNLIQL